MIYFSFPVEEVIIPSLTVPRLFHLTSCTPTTSNLYFDNSFPAALMDPKL